MRILTILNLLLAMTLTAAVAILFTHQKQRPGDPSPASTLRAHRVEVVDMEGHVSATIQGGEGDGRGPAISLLDPHGRQAVSIELNSQGLGTLYFSSPKTDAVVSVGYLWGSDYLRSKEIDPLAGWGLSIRDTSGTKNFASYNDPLSPTGSKH